MNNLKTVFWMTRFRTWFATVPTPLRRAVVLAAGGLLLALGAAMLVLPGPGVLTMALGVGLLATEFSWARRVTERGATVVERVRRSRAGGPPRQQP